MIYKIKFKIIYLTETAGNGRQTPVYLSSRATNGEGNERLASLYFASGYLCIGASHPRTIHLSDSFFGQTKEVGKLPRASYPCIGWTCSHLAEMLATDLDLICIYLLLLRNILCNTDGGLLWPFESPFTVFCLGTGTGLYSSASVC